MKVENRVVEKYFMTWTDFKYIFELSIGQSQPSFCGKAKFRSCCVIIQLNCELRMFSDYRNCHVMMLNVYLITSISNRARLFIPIVPLANSLTNALAPRLFPRPIHTSAVINRYRHRLAYSRYTIYKHTPNTLATPLQGSLCNSNK